MSLSLEKSVTMDSMIFGLQKFGGISNYWARLLSNLSTQEPEAVELLLPRIVKYRSFDPIWLEHFNVKREFYQNNISRYLNSSVAVKNGVYHTSYYRLPKKRPGKTIVTVYDFTYERFRNGFPRMVHSIQKNRAINAADAIICISNSTKNDVLKFIPTIDPSLLHVIHLGVDLNDFFPDSSSNRDCSDMVLFVGQRAGYKRFDLAISAIQQSPELRLGIIGPDLINSERENLYTKLGCRWKEFGPINDERLRQLYSSAYAFVFPSDYEGFGLPVLEAMACGCPVICSKLSSLPEVGGAAALYAERQDGEAFAACLASLADSCNRRCLIELGINRSQIFTWTQTINLTTDLYK